jgi:hypothetical protein
LAQIKSSITPRLAGLAAKAFGPISTATVDSATGTVTIPGLTTDSIVIFNVVSLTAGAIVRRVWPSAANTLSIEVYNTTATDPLAVSGTMNILIP